MLVCKLISIFIYITSSSNHYTHIHLVIDFSYCCILSREGVNPQTVLSQFFHYLQHNIVIHITLCSKRTHSILVSLQFVTCCFSHALYSNYINCMPLAVPILNTQTDGQTDTQLQCKWSVTNFFLKL